MLEEDPQASIQQLLTSIAAHMDDPSKPALPTQTSFMPKPWEVAVNVFFFTSLISSIIAAIGAVVCLEWVGEYDAGLEAASTPEQRALRSHYRYRGATVWQMPIFIASLPILLFVAVGFFLIGLTIWFQHTHKWLMSIPLTGLFLFGGGHALTTIAAIYIPDSPFRTAVKLEDRAVS